MPSIIEKSDAPYTQFWSWYKNAEQKGLMRRILTLLYPPAVIHQPEAMSLSSATADGKPSQRIVLFKGMHEGGFVFYTNYTSRKGRELLENPKVALGFHWAFPERQIRIEGVAAKVPYEKSSAYWSGRPRGSQISGMASPQSSVISDRKDLLTKMKDISSEYAGRDIPCPEYWGGFYVMPQTIEFWEGRINRCHERLRYTKVDSGWTTEILAP